MSYTFDSSSPIYLQLLNLFRNAIISSDWPPGSKMPSVRDLALTYGVNPNTVQRALMDLEREGLAQADRTNGRFITEELERIAQARRNVADQKIAALTKDSAALGLSLQECVDLLREHWPKEGDKNERD